MECNELVKLEEGHVWDASCIDMFTDAHVPGVNVILPALCPCMVHWPALQTQRRKM